MQGSILYSEHSSLMQVWASDQQQGHCSDTRDSCNPGPEPIIGDLFDHSTSTLGHSVFACVLSHLRSARACLWNSSSCNSWLMAKHAPLVKLRWRKYHSCSNLQVASDSGGAPRLGAHWLPPILPSSHLANSYSSLTCNTNVTFSLQTWPLCQGHLW